ncbi:MAG: helix-turn-helix domain-containing protein [Treponema sp.]|nr:helix-turn-helix domain-containing protein [Treponema sp.]
MASYNFYMRNHSEENEDTDSLRKTLSDNIRTYRRDLHLTQESLAENADISLSYLADIEHCKTWISDKTLLKLAKSLHKEPFELLIGKKANEEKTEIPDIHKISNIVFEGKKELVKSVSEICEKTIQNIMKVQ